MNELRLRQFDSMYEGHVSLKGLTPGFEEITNFSPSVINVAECINTCTNMLNRISQTTQQLQVKSELSAFSFSLLISP